MIYSCCTDARRIAVLAGAGAILQVPGVNAPGKNYVVGDVLKVAQPSSGLNATATVTAIGTGGAVSALSLSAAGTGYTTQTGVPTTGGTGSGCTLNIVSTPNGIDYLEVLDASLIAPGFSGPPLLLLHCLRPAPAGLTPRNVLITGGESITGIAAAWIAPASAAPAQTPPALAKYLAALPNAANILAVETTVIGDLSPYTLQLVKDISKAELDPLQTPEVLPGFDPQLASVQFAFRVDCGPDFDCAPQPPACAAEAWAPPAINYLAKDFGSFRSIMLDRLNQLLPGRMGSQEPDLGVALAELIAYTADMLSYRQDAITTEAYLETAQSRISLRRHAVLVDYHVHDGANARVWMQLQISGNAGTPLLLDKKVTRFYTYAPGMPPTLAPGANNEAAALLAGVQVFEPLYSVNLYPEHNLLHFYTWGDTNCCLPQGATEATLRGSYPNLKAGDVLIFAERKGPQTGDAADADLRHRCAVRLNKVAIRDAGGSLLTDPLFAADGSPLSQAGQTPLLLTEIAWGAEDALPFALCLSSIFLDDKNVSHSLTDVSIAWGNVVPADHGLSLGSVPIGTVPPAPPAPPASPGADRCQPTASASPVARFRPTLTESPLTQAVPLPLSGNPAAPSLTLSAAALMNVDPRDELPTISLVSTLPGEPQQSWTPQQDLLENGASDTCFVVEVESDGTASLRFGDNTNGRAPDPGTVFTGSYRIGNGSAGNVGAESLIFRAAHPNVESCTNPMPAVGGQDPETADQIRRRAPQAFLTQDRAVTLADYENVAEQNSGVNQAVATLRWTGSWYTVFVAAEPFGGGSLTPLLRSSLQTGLEQNRLVGQDLEVDSPQYVSLEIALTITVDPTYFQSHVKQSLQAVLGNQVLPDGTTGLFYADNFNFGQTVYLSPVYAAARSVPGVVSVVAKTFQPQGIPTGQYLAAGSIPLGTLQVARLENDPSYPDHGRLTLNMEGGK